MVSDVNPTMDVAHLGYVVRNMDRAIARFESEGGELTLPSTRDPIQGVDVAVLRLDDAIDVELVSPITEGSSPVDSRLARGGGLDHVCYYVDDVGSALERDESKGAMIVCPPTYACAFRRTIGFVQRRTGLVVEYMSRDEVEPHE